MRLLDLCTYDKITIQCHDNPDADALASGYGLFCYYKSKGKQVRLVYSGRNKIQKSNLCLMVEKLELPVEYIGVDYGETVEMEGVLLTVDCQYGSGNVTGISAEHVAVIDHHPLDHEAVPFSIINANLGSCSTLVWKLLKEENFDVDSDERLGTALYYGLYTDTNQFSELSNPLDMDMRDAVKVDKALITLFRNSNLSLKELEIAGIAMIRYTYNEKYHFAVIKAQPCDPNILGLISDFLLQVDSVNTCVVFNEVEDGFKFSVRSCVKEVRANELAAFLAEGIGSGGGHDDKAGGFIGLKLYEEKYPSLHSESFFNKRLEHYFNSYEIIYAKDYGCDASGMKQYKRKVIPASFVDPTEILPEGTPITIRTLEGDRDLQVTKDSYIVLGMRGDAFVLTKERFRKRYKPVEQVSDRSLYLYKTEYEPVMKNRENGKDYRLSDYARGCVTTDELDVQAVKLDHGVKVFNDRDKNRYMLGNPGDYLLIPEGNMSDIYVVPAELFVVLYEEMC